MSPPLNPAVGVSRLSGAVADRWFLANRMPALATTDSVLRSLGQDLLLGDERAVNVGQHE
jgi:hypothetical protein